jgi:hypothetical protein
MLRADGGSCFAYSEIFWGPIPGNNDVRCLKWWYKPDINRRLLKIFRLTSEDFRVGVLSGFLLREMNGLKPLDALIEIRVAPKMRSIYVGKCPLYEFGCPVNSFEYK